MVHTNTHTKEKKTAHTCKEQNEKRKKKKKTVKRTVNF